jgi:hypothetical protein
VALQRTGAELLVEAVTRQQGDQLRSDLELDPALVAQAVGDPRADQRADVLDLLGGQRPEGDRLVDAVDELR